MEFNFFGRLRLTIDAGGHRGYEAYFNNEYRRISAGGKVDSDAPAIDLRIVRDLPTPTPGSVRRSVRCKRLFTFDYLISGIDTRVVQIYFQIHPIDKIYINAVAVFLQAQIVEPIMYLKLLESDVLLMHAAGVCDGSNGYLFPASGGTGKTTFSIALLHRGFRLLGDDLVIVDVNEKMVYPYPRPLHLFTYNINNLLAANVPVKYRLAIYSKNVLRFFLERALRTEFLISTRVHADEIFEDDPFGVAVPYRRVFFLVKSGPAIVARQVDETNSMEVARQVMASADLNDSLYGLLGERHEVERVMRLEEGIIRRLLEQVGSITYVNTRLLDLSDLGGFADEYLKDTASSSYLVG